MRYDVTPLLKRRLELGLSQHAAAKLAGVHQKTLTKLESDPESSTPSTVKAIADALGVPMADLIVDDEPKEMTA